MCVCVCVYGFQNLIFFAYIPQVTPRPKMCVAMWLTSIALPMHCTFKFSRLIRERFIINCTSGPMTSPLRSTCLRRVPSNSTCHLSLYPQALVYIPSIPSSPLYCHL